MIDDRPPQPRLFLRSLSAAQARLRVQGPDARRYLHGMVSNDVQGLKPGQGCHACLLSIKGKLVGDLVVYDWGDGRLLLTLAAAARDGVFRTLDRHLIMDNASVEDVSSTVDGLLVGGSGAAAGLSAVLAAILPGLSAHALLALPRYSYVSVETASGPLRISAVAPLAQPTFHVFGSTVQLADLQAQLLSTDAQLLSADDYEILRVESGLPEYGRDLDEDRMPAEAGLDDAISFNKGCYMGQEVVVRLRDRGHLNRKLVGLRLPMMDPLPAVGGKLRGGERPQAGTLTSVVRSPRYGVIALAYVHRSLWDVGTQLELLTESDEPSGQLATISPLPFSD